MKNYWSDLIRNDLHMGIEPYRVQWFQFISVLSMKCFMQRSMISKKKSIYAHRTICLEFFKPEIFFNKRKRFFFHHFPSPTSTNFTSSKHRTDIFTALTFSNENLFSFFFNRCDIISYCKLIPLLLSSFSSFFLPFSFSLFLKFSPLFHFLSRCHSLINSFYYSRPPFFSLSSFLSPFLSLSTFRISIPSFASLFGKSCAFFSCTRRYA